MQARFLLGPAGSGKTFRCLAEIRAALQKSPEGHPLIFLAPKQATFQLERQLLAGPEISGYARLQIFSFERLAQSVLEKLKTAPPKFLSDDGRIMVLRALLMRHVDELKLFRQSARRPGFAQELGALLNELQQHQIAPAKLRALAEQKNLPPELRAKLDDLALLSEKYADWLRDHGLQDGNHLLDFAADKLRAERETENSKLKIEGLWLDGFAEMTPQELDLLAALLNFCGNATLAFCLAAEPKTETPGLSIWNGVGKTFQQCRQRLENLPGAKIEIEILPRDLKTNRFAKNPELARLEKNWAKTSPESQIPNPASFVRLVSCPNVEIEAVFAAREILKFVRAGNRFRDCAVLVRNLDDFHKPLAREFRRYRIPFFLDRRESAAHHPLAELTRSALRIVAGDWRQNDLFAALKAGFSPVKENQIDALENRALEFGWRGKKWREPLPDEFSERLRQKILPPFENFSAQFARLKFQPDGKQLAEIVRELWRELKVEQRLENWSGEISSSAVQRFHDSTHAAVFEQMNSWLENLALGFANEKMPPRDWLPVLEAGLANLTVGVIPPVLDEVLIGAVDRARNPDVKLALALGVNESVFPAPPKTPAILTNADRDKLESRKISFGQNLYDQISREYFLGYIACTRASEKLLLTFSRQSGYGKTLNPSPFVARLQNIFPQLEIEGFENKFPPDEIESPQELIPFLVQDQNLPEILALKPLTEKLSALREPSPDENLSPVLAEKLYGPVLRTSVSRLEEFAQCPFRFFVRSGLRAEERKVFELDTRERGSFQHDVLKTFHDELQNEKLRWRDLTPEVARERIKKIATGLIENFRGGLLRETAHSLFAARAMAGALQNFVEVTIGWLREQNEFDPAHAELDFGSKEVPQTAWEMDLANGKKLALRGRIDRVDLLRDENGNALAMVLDYKSSQKKLEPLLVEHGIQLQLLAYLNVLRRWKNPQAVFGAEKLIPAGVFYVNLRGQFANGTREEVLAGAAGAHRAAYQHAGRFDAGFLEKLDSQKRRDQFKYRLTDAGQLYANSVEALPRAEFEKLLDRVENQLRDFGDAIFRGVANVSPYKKGKKVPCEFCDYRAACRIDPWTHEYRLLAAAE